MPSIEWTKVIDEPLRRAFQCPETGAVTLDVIDWGNFHNSGEYAYWTCKVRSNRIDGKERQIREVGKRLFDISKEHIEMIELCEIEKLLFGFVKELKGSNYGDADADTQAASVSAFARKARCQMKRKLTAIETALKEKEKQELKACEEAILAQIDESPAQIKEIDALDFPLQVINRVLKRLLHQEKVAYDFSSRLYYRVLVKADSYYLVKTDSENS